MRTLIKEETKTIVGGSINSGPARWNSGLGMWEYPNGNGGWVLTPVLSINGGE